MDYIYTTKDILKLLGLKTPPALILEEKLGKKFTRGKDGTFAPTTQIAGPKVVKMFTQDEFLYIKKEQELTKVTHINTIRRCIKENQPVKIVNISRLTGLSTYIVQWCLVDLTHHDHDLVENDKGQIMYLDFLESHPEYDIIYNRRTGNV